MKTTLKLIKMSSIAMLLIVTLFGCNEMTETRKKATPEELSQMNRDFIKALNVKDAEAAANLYDENASLLPPNEPIVTGRANIQKYWQGLLDAGFVDGSVSTISTGSDGDLGYEIGRFELRISDSLGNMTTETGKYTELLKRNEDGKWISIYGMWNANE